MRHLLDDEEEEQPAEQERELTLSTGAILGIFFGLVLLCAAFFGFGYKMGSHKTTQTVEAAAPDAAPGSSTNFNTFKPAAGSPAGSSTHAPVSTLTPEAALPVPSQPAPSASTTETPAAPPEAAPIVHPPTPIPVRTIAPAASQPPPTVPTGSFLVQVAAFSHKEDADLLLGALRAKGYPAATYAEPDKLFHVQVGPFVTHKDAEVSRQRLIADGYTPILK